MRGTQSRNAERRAGSTPTAVLTLLFATRYARSPVGVLHAPDLFAALAAEDADEAAHRVLLPVVVANLFQHLD